MRYFAYGSNMSKRRMETRGIRFSKREHAILEGWNLLFNKISSNDSEGFANIKKEKGKRVEGIIYDIKDSDIFKLDKYEGYPEHYKRKKIKVRLDNGDYVNSITYIANFEKVVQGLKPSKRYIEYLLEGCDLLSKEYCEFLKNQETLD
jgi:cation transport regulator ChaC